MPQHRRPAATRSGRTGLLASSVVVAAGAVALAAPAVAQSPDVAIRGISANRLDPGTANVHRLLVACIEAGKAQFVDCAPTGTATLTVSAATKARLKLPSTVIAKGKVVATKANGEGEDGGRVDAVATSATRKRLKTAKTTFEVTYKLSVTSPIQEVVTTKMKWTIRTAGIARLLLRSDGDTADISGGGRG
ncbi:MAG: hypothetical protein JWO90_2634 [Solirubrobacterales bacterium]|nr:hypothetical protein [Solirubrobacterales bacterium]